MSMTLVPQGRSQKSKVLWNKLFRDFKWLLYLRREVLDIASVAKNVVCKVLSSSILLQPEYVFLTLQRNRDDWELLKFPPAPLSPLPPRIHPTVLQRRTFYLSSEICHLKIDVINWCSGFNQKFIYQ
jgi:hypothetical protein